MPYMPYKPTCRPNGKPRKDITVEQPERETANRHQRKEFKQPPSRRYVSGSAPSAYHERVNKTPPGFGQRKRVKQRRPILNPTPLKV